MFGEHFGNELGEFPPGKVGGPTNMKGQVIADTRWQRLEEMILEHVVTRIELNVTIKDKSRVPCNGNRAAIDLSTFHVALVQIFIVVGIETTARNFVKANNISIGD